VDRKAFEYMSRTGMLLSTRLSIRSRSAVSSRRKETTQQNMGSRAISERSNVHRTSPLAISRSRICILIKFLSSPSYRPTSLSGELA
jgi:hypothetical protein